MNFVEMLKEMTTDNGSLAGLDFNEYLKQSIMEGDDPRQYLNEYWLRTSDHFIPHNEDDISIMFQLDEIGVGILQGTAAFLEDLCGRTNESILKLFHGHSLTDMATMPEPRLTPYDIPNIKRIIEEAEKLRFALSRRNIDETLLAGVEDVFQAVIPRLSVAFSCESPLPVSH